VARVAVIGEALRIEGFALAGALVCPAGDPDETHQAWQSLPPDVAVVVLTQAAAACLAGQLAQRPGVLPVVMSG
jgi:vacuolar-type H+-ATPase subunit F/Vma7